MRFTLLMLLASFAVACLGCSQGPDDPMEQVRQLQEEQKWEESADLLRTLVDEDPENPETNFLLGVALMRKGEAGPAVWPLRKAAENPEYRIQAGLMLTRALLRGRNTHDAVGAATQVLSVEPDDTVALGLRTDAYLGISDYAKALDDANRVLELDPENVEVLVPRVMALIGLERIEEAEEALEVANAKVEGAGPRATEAIRGRVCAARAVFAFEQGDMELAEARHEECIEQFPKDVLVVQNAVEFYDKTQRPDFGTRLLERSVQESENPQLRSLLASRMRALGRPEDAERLLREEAEQRPSSTNWYRLADHYVQRDMNDEAIEAFEQMLAVTSNPAPMVRFAFADTLIQAGRYERARREADALADEPPLTDLLYGRMLLAQGDPKSALEYFGKGIKLWPNNPGARFFAAQAAERVGDFERAISEYRESLRANPEHTEAGLYLSYLYQALGRLPGSLDAVGRYLRSNGRDDPRAYLQSIRVSHRLGRRNVLAEGLRRLSRMPGQLPVAAAEEATLVAQDRGPAASLMIFERSPFDLGDPANAVALRVLLEQLAALGRHEQAESLVAIGLTSHPDVSVFHELQGRVLQAAGSEAKTIREAFEKAVELDGENAGALAGLAELAAASGNVDEATSLYGRAIEADPDDAQLAHARARVLLEAGQKEKAEELLAQLLRQHPLEGDAALGAAKLAADRGQLDRALHYSRWALDLLTPGSAEVLGRVQIKRGKPEQAVTTLSRVLEHHPGSSSARYGLGLALAAQGDPEAAREAFAAVAETDAPEAEKARTELAKLGS